MVLSGKLSVYELTRDYLDLLVHLPLFEAADPAPPAPRTSSGGAQEPASPAASAAPWFVSASEISAAAPAERLPFRMSRPLLDTTSSDSAALGKLLGIRSLNMAQLLVQVTCAPGRCHPGNTRAR